MKLSLSAKSLITCFIILTINLLTTKSILHPAPQTQTQENKEEIELNKIKNKASASSDYCGTPIDCYTKAINALNLAKQTYYSAVDKLESIEKTLITYTDEKVNNSTAEMKAFAESIREIINTKITSVQDSFDSKLNVVNNSVHNHVCREVDTGCSDDGGGNFVFADRHFVGCSENEFMKSWRWVRCDGNRTIRVHFTCCRNS